MGFPILGANTESAAYEISNSLRFNDGDSTYLNRTTGSPTNEDMVTISAWIKRSTLSANHTLMSWNSGNGAQAYLRTFNSNDNFQLFNKTASESNTSIIASAASRDVSAWYHLVLKYDAAQSTSSDRVKLYINGTEQTLGTSDYPPQNTALALNVGSRVVNIGRWAAGSEYVDGYVSEFAFIDGQALAPTSFAETDNNGVWIPKEFKDDVTFGNNGFYLEFKQTGTSANSSGIGADTSGNDNHFAVNNLGARNVVQDTPTNNFMTFNPLYTNSRGTFAEGNCQVTTNVQGSEPYGQVEFGNFHVNSGKWYWEVEVVQVGSGGSLGLGMSERAYSNSYINGHNNGGSAGNVRYNNSSGAIVMGNAGSLGTGATYTDGDTIMFAMDLDNSKFYTGKNGTWNNSQDPANGTNAFTLSVQGGYGDFWTPWISKDDTTHNSKVYLNTGNPVIANDSGNADDNGYGDFEYDVPAGFYALCTKNLAEYG